MITAPSVLGAGTLVASTTFTGESAHKMLAGGSLVVGAENEITFTLRVFPATSHLTDYENSASAVGTGLFSQTAEDVSNDGALYEDGAGDGNFNEAADNTPTLVSFSESAQVGSALERRASDNFLMVAITCNID